MPSQHMIDVIIRVLKQGAGATQTAAELASLGASAKLAGASLSSVGAGMASTGAMATLGLTLPMTVATVKIISAASATTESVNKMRVIFGDTADQIEKFSRKATTSIGATRQEAIDATSEFGALFKSMGFGNDQVTQMSLDLTQLAGDLASFYNVDTATALERIQAGMVGQSKPMRQFGVITDESAVTEKALQMGLAETASGIDQKMKVLARYALMMEKTSFQQGDFARTSGELANKMRILRGEFGNAAATLGTQLIPTATGVLNKLTDLARSFNNMSPSAQKATTDFMLFGIALPPLLFTGGKLLQLLGWLGDKFGALKAFLALQGITNLATAFSALGSAISNILPLLATLAPFVTPLAALAALNFATKDISLDPNKRMVSEAPDKYKDFAKWLATPEVDPATNQLRNRLPPGYRLSEGGYPVKSDTSLEILGEGGFYKQLPGSLGVKPLPQKPLVSESQGYEEYMRAHPEQVTAYYNEQQKKQNEIDQVAQKAAFEKKLADQEAYANATAEQFRSLHLELIAEKIGLADVVDLEDSTKIMSVLKDIEKSAMSGKLSFEEKGKWEELKILFEEGVISGDKLLRKIKEIDLLLAGGPLAIGSTITGGFIKREMTFDEKAAKYKDNPLNTFQGTRLMSTDEVNEIKKNMEAMASAGDSAAKRAADAIAKKWDDVAKMVTGALTSAVDAAKKLFDATGNMPGSVDPGANSWAEPFYRMADVAAAKERGKGKDTDKWAGMYYPGMGLDEASAAAKKDVGNFEMGNLLAPGVFEKIDWAKMADQAMAKQEGDKTMTYAGQAVAGLKAAGKPLTSENMKSMIDSLAAADKDNIIPSINDVKTAVNTFKSGEHDDMVNVLTALNALPASIAASIPKPAPPPSTPSGSGVSTTPNPGSGLGYADGTSFSSGGMSWVGERGPELVKLPMGSKVYNSRQSQQMQGVGGLGNLMDVIAQKAGASVEDVADALISAATVHVQGNMLKALQNR